MRSACAVLLEGHRSDECRAGEVVRPLPSPCDMSVVSFVATTSLLAVVLFIADTYSEVPAALEQRRNAPLWKGPRDLGPPVVSRKDRRVTRMSEGHATVMRNGSCDCPEVMPLSANAGIWTDIKEIIARRVPAWLRTAPSSL